MRVTWPQRGVGRERLDVLVEDARRSRRAGARAAAAGCAPCRGTCRSASRAAARQTKTVDGQRGGELDPAHDGERLGDRRLRPEDDRLGGHHAAGGVLVVGQQAAQVGAPRRAPSAGAAPRPASRGSSASRSAASSGCMASSTSAARSRAQRAEDLDLVVLGQLLEHVGEPLVVQRRGHLGPALGRQVVDDVGEVGGLEVVVGLEQQRGALAAGGLRCSPVTSSTATSSVSPRRRQRTARACRPGRPGGRTPWR